MEMLHLIPVTKPDQNKLDEAYEVSADISDVYLGVVIRVPKSFQYDGASIPSPVWQLIGTPFNPRFMTAAVFHDWIYHVHHIPRDDADQLFYELLLESGVSRTKAVLMREAVQNFGGWYWENDDEDKAYIKRLADLIIADGRNPADYGIL
jgi:hypothetical protein